MVWAGEQSSHSGHTISYIVFIYLLGFVFPLAIISTSYLKIIKTIRKIALKNIYNSQPVYRLKGRQPGTTQSSSRVTRDRRLTVLVAVMVRSDDSDDLSTLLLAGFFSAVLVPLRLHLYHGGAGLQAPDSPLHLSAGHPRDADQDLGLYGPNHLLLAQSPGKPHLSLM